MNNILLTGAGGAASIGYTRSIRDSGKKIRIAGTDASILSIAFSETDSNYIVPKANDPSYVDALNEIIEKEEVEFVHAQPDSEVSALSLHRNKIHAKTFLPSHEAIVTCQDKFKSYEAWKNAGLVIPESILIKDEQDLEEAFKQIKTPFWLRATKGAGGKGSFIVKEKEQAKMWISYWSGWGNFVASELLPGRLLTWQSIWNEGELIVAQGRERLSWGLSATAVTGVTGMTGVARTVAIKELDEIAEKAIRAVEKTPHGIYGVDLKCNEQGIPCPTEINIGRFFTTIHFFANAGLNMPSIEVDIVEGECPTFEDKYNPIKKEYFWLRAVDSPPRFLTEQQMVEMVKNEINIDEVLKPDSSVRYPTA